MDAENECYWNCCQGGRYEGTYAHKDIVFEIDLLVEHGEPLSNDTANKEDIGELSSRGL